MADDEFPTGKEIMKIHDWIEEEYDMKYRGTQVAAPRIKFKRIVREAREDYDDIYERAAFLLRKIIVSHYFEDGNKRTGWVVMREYLVRNSQAPAKNEADDIEPVLKAIRKFDVGELSTWLKTGDIDESKYNP